MICPSRVFDDEMKDILLRSNLVHPQTGWELDSGANEGFLARRESNEGATRDSKSNSKFQNPIPNFKSNSKIQSSEGANQDFGKSVPHFQSRGF